MHYVYSIIIIYTIGVQCSFYGMFELLLIRNLLGTHNRNLWSLKHILLIWYYQILLNVYVFLLKFEYLWEFGRNGFSLVPPFFYTSSSNFSGSCFRHSFSARSRSASGSVGLSACPPSRSRQMAPTPPICRIPRRTYTNFMWFSFNVSNIYTYIMYVYLYIMWFNLHIFMYDILCSEYKSKFERN